MEHLWERKLFRGKKKHASNLGWELGSKEGDEKDITFQQKIRVRMRKKGREARTLRGNKSSRMGVWVISDWAEDRGVDPHFIG